MAAVTDSRQVAPAVRVPGVIRRRLAPYDPRLDTSSWVAAACVALFAGVLRFVGLAHPPGKMFDEIYYATEAQGLLRHGVEWDFDNNVTKYVVHPPLGKWCIALGEALFGYDEFGWRISAAVFGTISVLMIVRIGRRLFGSTILGCVAGLLMAMDGMHFVLSRVALLDIFLMFFILATFGCLLIDRDQRRRAWLRFLADGGDPKRPGRAGRPRLGVPWWRIAAGANLGLALGVKWSAAYSVPLMILLVLVWEAGARRSAGARRPWLDTLVDEARWLAVAFAATAVAYLATWSGWFLTDDGYGRHRLAAEGGHETPILGALYNLYRYHSDALTFHTGLDAAHRYQSWPWQWLFLGRPVLLHYTDAGPCGTTPCSSAVLLNGTPVLWWSFLIALPLLVWFAIARRDWRAWAIFLGAAFNYVPWFYFQLDKRVMYYFYALPAEPFLILGVVYVFGALMTPKPGSPPSLATADRRTMAAVVLGGYVLLVALCFLYFYPIYTGQSIPQTDWARRMWLNSWI